jgi:predicted  nucleic acid-binding Zn-ribbon protein
MKKETAHTLIYIAASMAFLVMLGTCERKDAKAPAEASVVRMRELHTADSMRMAQMKAEIARMERERAAQQLVIDSLNGRISRTKPRFKAMAAVTANDTVMLADTIITMQDSVIEAQRREIAMCDSTAVMLSKGLELKDGMIAEYEYDIEELGVALAKARKRTWWDRNKAWIGIVGGMTIGGVGAWALCR